MLRKVFSRKRPTTVVIEQDKLRIVEYENTPVELSFKVVGARALLARLVELVGEHPHFIGAACTVVRFLYFQPGDVAFEDAQAFVLAKIKEINPD